MKHLTRQGARNDSREFVRQALGFAAAAAERLAVHAVESAHGQNLRRHLTAVADAEEFAGVGMFAMPLPAAEDRAAAHLAMETSRQQVIEDEQNCHQSHGPGQDGNGHGNLQKVDDGKANEKRQQAEPTGEGQHGRQ